MAGNCSSEPETDNQAANLLGNESVVCAIEKVEGWGPGSGGVSVMGRNVCEEFWSTDLHGQSLLSFHPQEKHWRWKEELAQRI